MHWIKHQNTLISALVLSYLHSNPAHLAADFYGSRLTTQHVSQRSLSGKKGGKKEEGFFALNPLSLREMGDSPLDK